MAMEPSRLVWLVPCLKRIELGCQVLLGHFGPVYLFQVSKMMMKNVASKSSLSLLFFLPNLPGPTVIPCPTSVPDSRVFNKL